MRKCFIILLTAILLCGSLAACAPKEGFQSPPPKSIVYLGGASILNQFSVTGGPGDPSGQKDIVVSVPSTLVMDGFHFAIVGEMNNGAQTILVTEEDLEPGSYLTITEEEYADYDTFSLTMDYTWEDTLMSMRNINLLSMEDVSSLSQEAANLTTTPPISQTFQIPQSTEYVPTAQEDHMALLTADNPSIEVFTASSEDYDGDGEADSVIFYYDRDTDMDAPAPLSISVYTQGHIRYSFGYDPDHSWIFTSEPEICFHHNILTIYVFCQRQDDPDSEPTYLQVDFTCEPDKNATNTKISTYKYSEVYPLKDID